MNDSGPLAIGSIFLTKYKVLAQIGRGGHAWVYRGQNLFTRKLVAIKIIHRPGKDLAEMVARGQAEAEFLANSDHPNIVKVLDAGILPEGTVYLVMELLEGRTLQDVLRYVGKLTIEETLAIVEQIAAAMEQAHSADVIHRDLKPANIFVVARNRVKVLDFGVAKMNRADFRTIPQMIIGSTHYMSPEQILGEINITPQSDIYALGLLMDEMLSGERTVPRVARALNMKADNLEAIVHLIVEGEDQPLHLRDPEIPAHIGRIPDQCMAKAIYQRPKSMRDVIEAIRTSRARYFRELEGRGSHCRDLSRAELTSLPSAQLHAPYATGATLRSSRPDPSDTERVGAPSFAPTPPPAGMGPQGTLPLPNGPAGPAGAPAQARRETPPPTAPTAPDAPWALAPTESAPANYFSAGAPPAPAPTPIQHRPSYAPVPPRSVQPAARDSAPPAAPTAMRPAPQEPLARGSAPPPVVQSPAAPRAPTKKAITPNTVSPVASAPPSGSSESKQDRSLLKHPAIIGSALFGAIAVGGGTLLYLQLKGPSAASAQPSDVVIESVFVTPPQAPKTIQPEPVAPPPAAASAPLPEAVPAPEPPRPAAPPTARAARPQPTPVARATSAASTLAKPKPKDLMEERLEMVEEELRRKGATGAGSGL